MTQPSKTTRWLDLLAFLLNRSFPVTREEIFSNVSGYLAEGPPAPVRERGKGGEGDAERSVGESARRKFERDKDELRQLGIEIETVNLAQDEPDQPNAGYRLRARDFYLPYFELRETGDVRRKTSKPYPGLTSLQLDQGELDILDRATRRVAEGASPLAGAAQSLRRKLAFDLPLGAAAVERVLDRPLDDATATTLRTLQEAVAARRAVRCRYYSIGRDAEETRDIEPYGLFYTWGLWYCVARARDRDALRVFRLERIGEPELLKDTFTVPDEFSIRDYLGRRPWELGEGEATRVTVRFAFPESRWVLSQGVGEPVDEMLDDGGAVLAFAVREPTTFLRWLLTFRGQARVTDPERLDDALNRMRREVKAIYDRR